MVDCTKCDLGDLLWRLRDIREMLMFSSAGGRSAYGCDEWSVPIVNLDIVIKKIEKECQANSIIG